MGEGEGEYKPSEETKSTEVIGKEKMSWQDSFTARKYGGISKQFVKKVLLWGLGALLAFHLFSLRYGYGRLNFWEWFWNGMEVLAVVGVGFGLWGLYRWRRKGR